MKKKWYVVGIFVALFMMGCVLIHDKAYAATDGWKDGYYYIDGKKQCSTWIVDHNDRYYLNKNGKKLVGWHRVGKYYYFFNAKGNNYQSGKKLGVRITKLSADVVTMGVDVSQYQGNVNWNKVKQSGVNFVMLRLGYGAGRFGNKNCELDTHFKRYVKELQDMKIPFGVYFYSYAVTPKQALEEAEFVIEQLHGIPVSFPVAYDVEDNYILNHSTTQTRTECILTFLDTISAAGYDPMYYSNWNWYTNYLDTEQLKKYDFWYARYTNEEPDQVAMPHTMWQATSTQVLPGITENTVDIDFLYTDYTKKIKKRSSAMKYGWHNEGDGLFYYVRGKKKTDGFFKIGGQTYYLTKNGAIRGWKVLNGKKYYFNNKGEMKTGIVKIKGKYYLFSEKGSLQYHTNKQGIKIDENGVCHIKKGWYQDQNKKFFYRKTDGSLAKSEWIETKGKRYYVGKGQRRVYGMKTIEGKRYYFDAKKNGAMKTGWLTYQGNKYYFQKNGQMVVNKTITIKGKKYTFLSDGKRK